MKIKNQIKVDGLAFNYEPNSLRDCQMLSIDVSIWIDKTTIGFNEYKSWRRTLNVKFNEMYRQCRVKLIPQLGFINAEDSIFIINFSEDNLTSNKEEKAAQVYKKGKLLVGLEIALHTNRDRFNDEQAKKFIKSLIDYDFFKHIKGFRLNRYALA